jgi:DNA polymerase-3 subunit delta
MRSKLNPDFIAMSFQVFDNIDYQKLITILRTPPMMFGETLIVINCDKYLTSQKNYFEDNELKDIENALDNNVDSVNIVFVAKLPRNENKKLDSRRKIYKILSKYNSQEFATFKAYKTAEISAWIKNHAKKQKSLTLDDDAVELLIEYIGNDLRQFDIELDKLKLIAYPQKNITKKMVQEIAITNQDLFNITELIVKNQKDKALLEFQKLTDKKHPLEILAAIQTMLRKFIIIKIKHKILSSLEISKTTGMHEYVVKQTITKLKNTTATDLIKLKQNLYDVECKIKSAEALDIIPEVEIALIR